RRGRDRQGARRAWLRSAISRAVNRGHPWASFAKASPPCGQGVTFFVNQSLILLRVCNTAKTLTSEWESGSAAPRFGHTRRSDVDPNTSGLRPFPARATAA